MEENIKSGKRDWLLPASIVVAALLIAGSLFYNAGSRSGQKTATVSPPDNAAPSVSNARPVSAADHILGNKDAPIVVVEYSDLECPFCKRFHPVMQQVLQTYGGKAAWVYRHLPLDALHPKARREAEASECAAEQGGNDAFWAYIGKIFEITPSNNGLDPNLLPQVARDVGLDVVKFNECLSSGKYAEKVAADVKDAENAGARGTPYSLVLKGGKAVSVIPGALPFDQVKALLDEVLAR